VDAPRQPIFYYDLGSPQCYIVAETIMATLPAVPEWEPVLGASIAAFGRTAEADRSDPRPEPRDRDSIERLRPEPRDRDSIERLAAEHSLQPLRWPNNWPPDTRTAMLAATYAKRIGRAVAFSLAAFRQAFAGGRDLGDEDTILIAGAACEMHPTALRRGVGLTATATALETATRRAQAAGATRLPAIQVGDHVYAGLDAIDQATIALRA
jgi:2-hydroxychromene-2-carboxylate isomerase